MRLFTQERKPAPRNNPIRPVKRERQVGLPPHSIGHSLHQLQRTVGNQAVLRMLHGSTSVQRQPKQPPPPNKVKNLKDAGHSVNDLVFSKTAEIIDAVLQRNQKLAPYIGERLKSGLRMAEKGKFVQATNNGDFETAYRNAYDIHKSETVPGHIMGFYDRNKATIHLRPQAKFGTALHEAVHKLASPTFYDRFLPAAISISKNLGEVLLEGLTSYFTDAILDEEKLPPFNSYPDLKKKAEQLATTLGADGFDLLAKFNFKGGAIIEIGNKLGLTTKQYTDLQTKAAKEVLTRMNKVL